MARLSAFPLLSKRLSYLKPVQQTSALYLVLLVPRSGPHHWFSSHATPDTQEISILL